MNKGEYDDVSMFMFVRVVCTSNVILNIDACYCIEQRPRLDCFYRDSDSRTVRAPNNRRASWLKFALKPDSL